MREYQIDVLVSGLKTYFNRHRKDLDENIYYEICELLDGMLPKNKGKTGNSVFKEIKENFKNFKQEKNRFAFVLGAGVSNDFGIPNWSDLIYRLNFSGYWERTHCNTSDYKFVDDKEKLKPLFQSQNNLYEWAQYAENNFYSEIDSRNKWQNVPSHIRGKDLSNRIYSAVKKSLYYDARTEENRKKIIDDGDSVKTKGLKIKDSSLSCIGEIIKAYNMDRVITYNYDDCLEYVMNKYCEINDYLPVFDKEQLLNEGKKCTIYHVHGFIPYFSEFRSEVGDDGTKDNGTRFKEIKTYFDSWDGRKLILTEVSYDEMTDEIYKWRNAVQVDTFLRYNCFFVGFSATDINFKRIVKQLTKKTAGSTDSLPHHYIAVCLDDYIGQIPKTGNKTEVEYYDINSFITILGNTETDDMTEDIYGYISSIICMLIDRKKYLERYNITPLFTTVADLPHLLGELAVAQSEGSRA